jgi:DNA-binding transcriptional regulator YiaG
VEVEQIMQHDTAASSSAVAGRYCADVIGAPFKVYLADGYTITQRLGEEIISIKDLPGLIAAIVQARVLHPRKLSGADLKFIRIALRMKSKTVADALELTPEHYSRCESGPKSMSAATEKTYRAFVFLSSILRDEAVQKILKTSDPLETPSVSPKKAEKTFAAFTQVFMGMKIKPVADATEELAFSFSWRGPNQHKDPCGDGNEAEWEKVEPKPIAA